MHNYLLLDFNECLNTTTNWCNAGSVAICTDEEGSVNPLGYECSCPGFYELNAVDRVTCDGMSNQMKSDEKYRIYTEASVNRIEHRVFDLYLYINDRGGEGETSF